MADAPRVLRIALVSSVGGHLAELLELSPAFEGHSAFWVLNDDSPVLPPGVESYRISHAERDWRVAYNLFEIAGIFARTQPDLIVSTGAGPAVPAAVVARLIGIPVVYIEGTWAVKVPTLTGRLMRLFTRRFYVQWPTLRERLPGSRYVGGLL
jgi:beta-1,4-N-acetylglucosaminyltransferase